MVATVPRGLLQPPATEKPLEPSGYFTQAWALHFQRAADLSWDVQRSLEALILDSTTQFATIAALAQADAFLAASPSYADDAAAAIGGVAVGERYRDGSVVMVRVA